MCVFDDVFKEIKRAELKHGNQNHLPSLDQTLLKRAGGCSVQRMCDEYEMPSEIRAKNMCNYAYQRGELTHAHIVVEELCETIACLDDEQRMREELIQVIATATNWVISIDEKHKKETK